MLSDENNVIIIGAGLSGIGLAVQLQRKLSFYNYKIYERNYQMGGTWNQNRYPGAGCDIPSLIYSFSFAPKYDWSRVWASQPEILDYILQVGKQYKIENNCVFGTECVKSQWDVQTKRWIVDFICLRTKEKFQETCKVLIVAPGGLSNPNDCPIPGRDDFNGPIFHSSNWNDSVDLTDKNVIVIGNGCSATQIIPTILPQTKTITQFVRSAHSLVPLPVRNNKTPSLLMFLFKYVPLVNKFFRLLLFIVLDYDFALFKWLKGKTLRKYHQNKTLQHIRENAPKKYLEILTPNFDFGLKRRVLDTDYLSSLHSLKVTLRKEELQRIIPQGVINRNGVITKADVIIYANGFKVYEFMMPMEIIGENGQTVKQYWEECGMAQAYKSAHLYNCPNFVMLPGPNSGTGHHSVLFTAECVINHTISYLKPLLVDSYWNGAVKKVIRVKKEAEDEYQNWIVQRMKELIWEKNQEGGWYVDKTTGTNSLVFPDYQTKFWWNTLWVRWNDFLVE